MAGVPAKIQLCYDNTHLAKINPRSPMSGQPTSISAVNQALCIEKQNVASKVSTVKHTIPYGTFSNIPPLLFYWVTP